MKVTYSSKIKKKLSSPSEIKKAFGTMARKVQSRLDEIEASPNLKVLMQIPSANCHALLGSKAGEWALNISVNHRMIFVLDHDPIPRKDTGEIETIKVTDIKIVETTDYH